MRLVGTVIRSRNVGRQMAVVETWMEVRRLAFPFWVKTRQNCKKSHERYHSVVMWHWLCTNGVEATKCRVFIAHFSIYSTSRCRCHAGTDNSETPWSHSSNQPGGWFNIKMLSYQYRKSHCGDKTILRPSYLHNGISYTGKTTSLYWIRAQVVRTVRHRISCCAPTIHWKCDAQIPNRQMKPVKTLVIPMSWSYRCFEWQGASMLLEPTTNKLKQWQVIEKNVNKCNLSPDIFKL